MAVKRLYRAFADHLDEKQKEELEAFEASVAEFRAKNPTFNRKISVSSSEEAQAIRSGDVSICEFFCLESDLKDGLEFSTPHAKSVAQTVRANVTAYKSILLALDEETNEDYKKVYKSLKSAYDKYFALAAEDVLEDVYGEEFTSFKAEYEAKHSKKKDSKLEA